MHMHHGVQAGLVAASAKHVAKQMPIAALFGSNDIKSSYDNFHQLKAKGIDGNEVNFADLNGKVGQHVKYKLREPLSSPHAYVCLVTGRTILA